jgi:queuosine precursor transporter
MNKRQSLVFATFAAFVFTVWLANWLLTKYGTVPVGFGLEAPAGVYAAGLGFLLRDVLHELGGRVWVVGGILTGAVVSYFIDANVAIPGGHVSIAVASGIAFLLSEFADFSVYTPLRERSWPTAVGLSQIAGAVLDSAVFLWLAFGAVWTSLFAGQIVGKTLFVLPVVLAMFAWKRTRVAPA